MPLESPISVLFDSFGTEIAVSQSQVVSGAAQPGLMIAGSASNGGAVFFRMAADGALFITGSIVTTAVATQSVFVGAWGNTTASVKVDVWTPSVTASTREIGAATTLVSSAISSLTNFALLAVNPDRKKASFYKEGGGACYLKLGATASATSYTVQLGANGYFETPDGYTGRVDVVFTTAVATSILRVTEITVP